MILEFILVNAIIICIVILTSMLSGAGSIIDDLREENHLLRKRLEAEE